MPCFVSPSRRAHRRTALGLVFVGWFATAACGDVTCPQPLSAVDGVCEMLDSATTIPDAGVEPEPSDELCDGIDNDGDSVVDEDWPVGQPCGEARGECMPGTYVCDTNGRDVVCEGGVGPVAETCDGKDNDCDGIVDDGPAETCDGKDNDCDGIVDEGAWSIKRESFDDHASVASIDGGFVVTRFVANQIRVETYAVDGTRTSQHDDIDNPVPDSAFLQSDTSGSQLLVSLGKHSFVVLEGLVDASLVPIIIGVHTVHEDWDQGIDWGVYMPPRHPRVVASPRRFLGHRDLITFALSPFDDELGGLESAPTAAQGLPYSAYFDVDGSFVVWEQADNVRAGWLLDDGSFVVDIDVARGRNPAIALAKGGPGVVFLRDGRVTLSELGGASLQCRDGRYCNSSLDAEPIPARPTTAMGLAFDEAADTWVVAASEQLLVVARRDGEAVVKQSVRSSLPSGAPNRIDVAMSGGTAAVVQSTTTGESVLTFMGCF